MAGRRGEVERLGAMAALEMEEVQTPRARDRTKGGDSATFPVGQYESMATNLARGAAHQAGVEWEERGGQRRVVGLGKEGH